MIIKNGSFISSFIPNTNIFQILEINYYSGIMTYKKSLNLLLDTP